MTTRVKDAATELAELQLHAQFPSEVTVADARDYVTPVLFSEWGGVSLASMSEHNLIGEVIETISADDLRSLLCALIIDNQPKACEILKRALIDYVAKDLAYEANRLIENYEPTDAELDRVGDALASEARSFVRRHNASIAAWRVLP